MFLTEQKILRLLMQEQFRPTSSSTKLLVLQIFEVHQTIGELCEQFLAVLCKDTAICLD